LLLHYFNGANIRPFPYGANIFKKNISFFSARFTVVFLSVDYKIKKIGS